MITSYKVRTACVFFTFFGLFALALLQLFSLQIRKHGFFHELATRQYQVKIITHPERALIIDRNNKPLALNKDGVAAFILPQQLKNPQQLREFLSQEYPEALERLTTHSKAHFLYIKRKLTDTQLEIIKQANIEDINFLTEPNRFYPNSAAATLTGITSIDNEGLFGIEKEYNQQLAGTPTVSELEKDARSGRFYFSKTTTQEGQQGKPIQLTIDNDIQFLVQEAVTVQAEKFQVSEAAAVVLDPANGDIIAMASYPTFDPNNTETLNIAATKNCALTETYEFGSALKAFTALAALEEQVVTPDEPIDCEDSKTALVEGRRINNWEAQGVIPFEQVIMRSNNIGIAKVAMRLDTKLYDHYKQLGFGKKTGIGFAGEQAGFVNPPEQWSKQSIISLSYGYEIRATLLQLAQAFSIFANNGKIVKPRLLMTEPVELSEQLYSPESIVIMNNILEKTTSSQGTARYAALNGFVTRGKTSTANLLVDGKYDETKNLYGFVGTIEKGYYNRVIAVFLKESPRKNLYASTVAAPLFKTIVEKLLIHAHVLAGDTDEVDNPGNSAA